VSLVSHGLAYPATRRRRGKDEIGDEPERSFMQRVLEYLKLRGWTLIYHAYDSTRSPSGFPDIIALRRDRGLALECKSQHGDVKRPQREWIAGFDAIPGFLGAVVRPSDWPWIEEVAR
jgi:hypothetical protein